MAIRSAIPTGIDFSTTLRTYGQGAGLFCILVSALWRGWSAPGCLLSCIDGVVFMQVFEDFRFHQRMLGVVFTEELENWLDRTYVSLQSLAEQWRGS